jgi:hypothetical protein
MSCYISIYIKTCDLCNQTKLQHQCLFGKLHPLETPEAPWDVISVDFIVELVALTQSGHKTLIRPTSHIILSNARKLMCMIFLLIRNKIYKNYYFYYYYLCKGNLTNLRRELHLSLAKANPK